jgi:inosose dehydratase
VLDGGGLMKLATAPGTWGIEPPPKPGDPPWQRILDEIAAAGFDGSELGPYGYYPVDPAELQDAFVSRNLELPAGFVMEQLATTDREPVLDIARRTCATVARAGGHTLVLIDGLDPGRVATAGRSQAAQRLAEPGWRCLTSMIEAVRALADEHGLALAFHPHAGTCVEFEDEIERLMEDVDLAVGLCLDTGHALYAGIDPVALVQCYAGRILHVHLKDIELDALRGCLAAEASFLEAVAGGVFTPLGEGSVDLAGVAEALAAIGYDGWATFEQDRVLASIDQALEESRRSLLHARAVGY